MRHRRWRLIATIYLLALGSLGPVGSVPFDRAASVAAAAAAAAAAVPAGASRFVPLPPTRLVDTREGVGVAAEPIGTGDAVTVAVTGHAGVPAAGVSAIVLNATVTDTTGAGFVTIWPNGQTRPTVSNVNATAAGQTVANLVVVRVGTGGSVSVFAQRRTDLVLDVAGYFTATSAAVDSGRFMPVTPSRLLDTRDGDGAPAARPGAGGTVHLAVAGHGGVPESGAAAVAMTVTATESAAAGYVTAWPGGASRPLASNLNLPGANATVANVVLVPLGADGSVDLFTQRPTHLVADVVGWFTGEGSPSSTSGLFVPMTPVRVLDTRDSQIPVDARFRRDLNFGLGGSAAGVITNLTITNTSGALYLTAYPGRTPRPLASNLNADRAGVTAANLAVVPLTAGDRASVYVSADTDLVADVAGWFTGTPLSVDASLADTPPTTTGTSGADAARFAAFDQAINAFLADKKATGASVAVARHGRIVHVRSYGQSDASTGEVARVDSRFRIASQSKPLLATAIMRLAERGELSLDDRVWPMIDKRVPLPAGADPRMAAITVRQLLSHSAGFITWLDPLFNEQTETVDQFGPEGAHSCEEASRWFLGTWPLAWDPGTKYAYANIDYCLLGIVVETVTGQPWSQVVDDEVLARRGITDMRTTVTRGDHRAHEAVHVTPAADEPGGGWFMETLGPAGSWLGTATDLVRFLDGLDPTRPGQALIAATTSAAMSAKPSYALGSAWYGLGLRVYDNGASWGHTGSLRNARAMMLHQADGTTWAILVDGSFDKHGDELSALMSTAISTVTSWPTTDLGPNLP